MSCLLAATKFRIFSKNSRPKESVIIRPLKISIIHLTFYSIQALIFKISNWSVNCTPCKEPQGSDRLRRRNVRFAKFLCYVSSAGVNLTRSGLKSYIMVPLPSWQVVTSNLILCHIIILACGDLMIEPEFRNLRQRSSDLNLEPKTAFFYFDFDSFLYF